MDFGFHFSFELKFACLLHLVVVIIFFQSHLYTLKRLSRSEFHPQFFYKIDNFMSDSEAMPGSILNTNGTFDGWVSFVHGFSKNLLLLHLQKKFLTLK